MHRPFFITESQIYLSKDIERIQLRAMRITVYFLCLGSLITKQFHCLLILESLKRDVRLRVITCLKKSLKIQITNFAALLPDLNSNTAHSLRTKRTFDFPIIKTNRYMNTFIIASSKRFNS